MAQKSPRSDDSLIIQISALLGVLACVGDICMIHLLGKRWSGYKPLFQAMSDLGHDGSPVARAVSAGWVLMGLMFVIFGYGFYRAFVRYSENARAAGWMLAFYGIGEGFGSSLIPGTPGKIFETPRSIFHNLASAMGVLAAMLLPFIIMKMFHARKSSCLYCWLTAISGIFFFLLFALSNFCRPHDTWISCLGLWQRLYTPTYFLFFIYLAALMLIEKNTILKEVVETTDGSSSSKLE
jgi:hypothetical protein